MDGLRLDKDMSLIYAKMGVCPQHDILWESLTGRHHIQFFGRLKGLSGAVLESETDTVLRSVNLSGSGDRKAGGYSGGMKRRLSVANSLIGNPDVVYMDEPSTGLDPGKKLKFSLLCHYTSCNYRKNYFYWCIFLLMCSL